MRVFRSTCSAVFLITAEDSGSLCYLSPVFQVGIVSELDRNCCDISAYVKRQLWFRFNCKMSVERVYLQCIVYVNRYLWFTCNVKGRNHFHFYILYQLKKKELLAICQSSVFNWTKVRTHQRLSRSFILQTLLCIVRFLKQRFPSMQQSNKRELQYIAVHFSTCSSLW